MGKNFSFIFDPNSILLASVMVGLVMLIWTIPLRKTLTFGVREVYKPTELHTKHTGSKSVGLKPN